ncbi:MAG: ParB/RepB/Spo0J family partition protein [Cryomorphaceae bacterium]
MAKRAMGKGLSAILGDEAAKVNKVTDKGAEKLVGSVASIPVDSITTNPFQPRSNFDNDALVELAQSISEVGIIQPITVRKNGMKFELISGERRFRASQMAGLQEIPAYVRLADDRQLLELAIVENLQREDLDPIEMAYSCKRMMDELGLTQEQVAQRLGKGRSTITNFLRLLKLPALIQAELRDLHRNESADENNDGTTNVVFTMGHARALLNLPTEENQIDIYKKILKEGLSVRKVEAMVKAIKSPEVPQPKPEKPSELLRLEGQLTEYFSTKVAISQGAKGKGKIQIDFTSDQELAEIIAKLNG